MNANKWFEFYFLTERYRSIRPSSISDVKIDNCAKPKSLSFSYLVTTDKFNSWQCCK